MAPTKSSAAPAAPSTAADPIRIDSHNQPDTLEGIVRIANEKGYSDVHLGVGEEPRYRARGEIAGTGWPVTDSATFHAWLKEMLSPSQIDQFLIGFSPATTVSHQQKGGRLGHLVCRVWHHRNDHRFW